MPCNPLREEHIKQLIGQLRGVEVAERVAGFRRG